MPARIGDVIAIRTSRGYALAQYTHRDKLYGALLRVLAGFSEALPGDGEAAATAPTAFHTFFPLNAALKRGLVTRVGNAPVPPSHQSFPLMRRRGRVEPGGRVLDWWLWDGTRQRQVARLEPAERDLSIAEVVNDTLLIERLEAGWQPRDIS
ncbi:hypothetical protein [Jatrophihabitans sp.]|uniref:hypothetical protein n=1 Tax=Jatrophihabitans sp. TaxID=1932789 RepID=UPI002BF78D7A|nr:hypothetical protein [Jatrophihabitans sp.]